MSPNFSGLFLSVKPLELYRLVLFDQILPPHMFSDLYEQPVYRVAVYHATRRAYKVPHGQYIVMAQRILGQSVYKTRMFTCGFVCVCVRAHCVEHQASYVKIKFTQPKLAVIPTDIWSSKKKKSRSYCHKSQLCANDNFNASRKPWDWILLASSEQQKDSLIDAL
jgi:hypothetical protein